MSIRVMIKETNREAYCSEIENDLTVIQNIVEGNIELVPIVKLFKQDIGVIVNEEGKLLSLDSNILLLKDEELVNILVGNIIFVGIDRGMDFCSLSDEQIGYIKSYVFDSDKYIDSRGRVLDVVYL